MSEGPTRREIDRVREAMERHDSELSEDGEERDDEPGETSGDEDEDE
jgi:hypothetical protein